MFSGGGGDPTYRWVYLPHILGSILRRSRDPIPVTVDCEVNSIMDFTLTSHFVETPFSSLTKHSPDLYHGTAAVLIYESVIVGIDYCNSVGVGFAINNYVPHLIGFPNNNSCSPDMGQET